MLGPEILCLLGCRMDDWPVAPALCGHTDCIAYLCIGKGQAPAKTLLFGYGVYAPASLIQNWARGSSCRAMGSYLYTGLSKICTPIALHAGAEAARVPAGAGRPQAARPVLPEPAGSRTTWASPRPSTTAASAGRGCSPPRSTARGAAGAGAGTCIRLAEKCTLHITSPI